MSNEVRDARHRRRRDEIITAARTCFRQYGFHAASMAQLASAAHLSVGQIYRYFSNKDAIIEEIVRRIVELRLREIVDGEGCKDIPRLLAWRYVIDEEDDVLMLEVAAEATRNARVAEMMQEADERILSEACQRIKRDHPEFSDQRTRSCVEILAVLVEGTSRRRLTSQKTTPESLYPLYQNIYKVLFNSEEL